MLGSSDAAEEGVLLDVAFQAASVEEIAEEAGYSHGAVYLGKLEGKADLFLAVFEDYMARARPRAGGNADRTSRGCTPSRSAPVRWPISGWTGWLRTASRLSCSRRVHRPRRSGPRAREAVCAPAPSAMREAVARYIAHYQQEAGAELAMPVEDLALVLRALGIGLGDRIPGQPRRGAPQTSTATSSSCLVSLMRESRSGKPPRRRASAKR